MPFVFVYRYKHDENFTNTQLTRGCPRGVMVKAMDCGSVVSEFELQIKQIKKLPVVNLISSFK